MTDKLKTESGRSLPQAPTFFERHAGDRDAILAVIATLERAANTSTGDLFDSVLSEEMPSVERNRRCFRRSKRGRQVILQKQRTATLLVAFHRVPPPKESMKRFVENHRLKRA
jgi:phosphomannomutase